MDLVFWSWNKLGLFEFMFILKEQSISYVKVDGVQREAISKAVCIKIEALWCNMLSEREMQV